MKSIWFAIPESVTGRLRSAHSRFSTTLRNKAGGRYELFANTPAGRQDFYRVACELGPLSQAKAEEQLAKFGYLGGMGRVTH